jgi:hypothetical protein
MLSVPGYVALVFMPFLAFGCCIRHPLTDTAQHLIASVRVDIMPLQNGYFGFFQTNLIAAGRITPITRSGFLSQIMRYDSPTRYCGDFQELLWHCI